MKVLEINVDSGYGSTGRIASDIARELEDQGHEVVIAYGRELVDTGVRTHRIGSKWDVYTHVLQTRLLDTSGFGSTQATQKFIRWIQEYDPDVIHLHNLHGYYLNVETLFDYLRTCGKKIIWTLHDCWSFTGHCAVFSSVGCQRWREGCFDCPQKGEYPTSLLRDHSLQNFGRKKKVFTGIPNMILVTPSQWLADLVKQSFLREYPVTVIHNGIATDIFRPTPSGLRERYHLNGKKVILGVASIWSKSKGLEDFAALSELLSTDEQIVLIGLTEQQCGELPEKILGIQRTNSLQELAEWYSASDVFFNPTYEDNYPTTNLEAQACGTPCITYRTGGSVESVPKENVVPQGGFRQAAQLMRGNLEVLEEDRDKKRMLEKYLDIYVEMVE